MDNHAWLIVGKSELFYEENYEEILWNIIEMLVRDLEAKDNDDLNEDSKVMYGPPYSKSLKHTSDIYIYTAVISSLGSVLKLSLNFDEKDDIISRIITTTCNLYYKTEINEFKRPAFDLINYAYQSQTFSKYLENLRHPILSGEEPNSDDDQDFELTKTFGRSKSQSRKSNIFGGLNDRSKATTIGNLLKRLKRLEIKFIYY